MAIPAAAGRTSSASFDSLLLRGSLFLGRYALSGQVGDLASQLGVRPQMKASQKSACPRCLVHRRRVIIPLGLE